LQILDGKARVIRDLFCDGSGACIGDCPEGAIEIETRDAETYDEYKVMGNIAKAGPSVIKAHLRHLQDRGREDLFNEDIDFLKKNTIEIPDFQEQSLACGCPGSMTLDLRRAGVRPVSRCW
jgi:ferredoxin